MRVVKGVSGDLPCSERVSYEDKGRGHMRAVTLGCGVEE